jgi:hypothetical protein
MPARESRDAGRSVLPGHRARGGWSRTLMRPAIRIRERLLSPVPHKIRYARARLTGGDCRTVLFLPGRPNPHHVLYKLMHARGWRIGGDPAVSCDLACLWSPDPIIDCPPQMRELAKRVRVLNIGCTDISKRRVDAAAAAAFGHDIRVDPLTHVGVCVRKSDENAHHDGRVVVGPVAAPDPRYVYQRLVDNLVGDGMVEDIRLPVFGDIVPFGYRKYRPVAQRFSNKNSSAEVAPVDDLLSADELTRFLAFCRDLRLDYGEVDVLRDRGNGRLYVVDANPTPFGPPNHIARGDARRAMAMLAEAFDLGFGSARG